MMSDCQIFHRYTHDYNQIGKKKNYLFQHTEKIITNTLIKTKTLIVSQSYSSVKTITLLLALKEIKIRLKFKKSS